MNMKVVFKNGKQIKITQIMANVIRDKMVTGVFQWQIFTDENKDARLFVNLDEVAYITQ